MTQDPPHADKPPTQQVAAPPHPPVPEPPKGMQGAAAFHKTQLPRTMGNAIAPWRHVIFAALFVACLIADWLVEGNGARAVMIAFDTAAFAFLVTLAPLFGSFTAAQMRAQALRNDANRNLLLALAIGVSMVIFVAVGYEVVESNHNLGIVIVTLTIAWLFANAMFGLHYAHIYYMQEEHRGLHFAGNEAPDYNDFFYFAFTLGMTSQTSDVAITTRRMRRLVLGHTLAAYLFNLGAIAFTVNTIG